jgi:plasmid stabilization system protein ParE
MVIWSKNAKVQLQKAFNYISQNSVQNAEKVRDEIIDLTIHLSRQSEIYPLDKYKQNNDGTYRAFEIYRYRISYRIINDTIHILRMRHTSMSPLIY